MKRNLIIIAIVAAAFAALTLAASSGAQQASTLGPAVGQIAYFNYDASDKGIDVMLMNADGSGGSNITHDGTAKQNVDPNWSANGSKVAFTRYFGDGSSDIMVVGADGKGLVNVTGPSFRRGISNIHPAMAPNGSIVFASNRDGNFDLYRVAPLSTSSGRHIVRMTNTVAPVQNLSPDFSSNGSMLVFSRVSSLPSGSSQAASLFLMRATPEARPTRLTTTVTGTGDRAPAFSPSGKQIAFHSDRNGNNDLYVLTLGEKGAVQLTFTKAAQLRPSWSPDGNSLVFLSDQTSHTELWVLSLVSTQPGPPNAWQITFDKTVKGSPDWQPITPGLNG
jgi:Tol biopolymer transport system component